MIGHVKPQNGKVFKIGNAPPGRTIYLQGSCRALPYAGYFQRYMEMTGDSLMVYCLDPHDHHWDEAWNPVPDFYEALRARENDPEVRRVLRESSVFIHEHYANYGMFNTTKDSEKNIYQFGMAPSLDVCIPNVHDLIVLYNDVTRYNEDVVERLRADGGTPSPETLRRIKEIGEASIDKFCNVCSMSSFPEFGPHFRENWTKTRFFWTTNHVTRHATMFFFKQLNDKYLHLPLTREFWAACEAEDQFRTPRTTATEYDKAMYGLTWDEL